MMPGMDPRQMQQMMKQMGIKSEEISAKSVVIETEDSKLIIDNPQVTKISMQGNDSFQISGTIRKEESIAEDDVKMVAEQGEVSEEKARQALVEAKGDIAEAIMKLKEVPTTEETETTEEVEEAKE
jgi:nascent polypeptide-associated complex subunit alpha